MAGKDTDVRMDDGHLDANEVAAYVDRTLPQADRARVDAHLADCDDCRGEVVAVRRLVAGTPRWRRWSVMGALAAAAVLVLVMWPSRPNQPVPEGPVVRGGEHTATAVVPVAPAAVATLPLSFVWHAVPSATSYRLSLTSADGALLWSAATSDTSIALPDSVSLAAGGTYYYYVDALLADGTSGTSGVRAVRVRP
jgi:anti-sigma factor RsiW